MPVYTYRFIDGQEFEVEQRIDEPSLTEVTDSTGETRSVKKVYTPFFATYTGSGWARGH